MKIFKDGIFASIASHASLFSLIKNKSLVEIFLWSSSLGNNIPLVQFNDDIREFCCDEKYPNLHFKIDWNIKNLSSTINTSTKNTHSYVIRFNINIDDDVADDLIYMLTCFLGLKYRCVRCAYHYGDKEREILLHYD